METVPSVREGACTEEDAEAGQGWWAQPGGGSHGQGAQGPQPVTIPSDAPGFSLSRL